MKEKILNILFIVFGLFMANSGINKFTNHMSIGEPSAAMQELFGHLMAFGWLMPLVGIVELIGGVLIVIPKTRLIGAITLLPIMTGILLTHIVNDPSSMPMAIVFFVLNAAILVMGRNKLCELKS
jgi:putative oxidoreductase